MGIYIQGININNEDYLMEQFPRERMRITEAEVSYTKIASFKMVGNYCYIDFVLRAVGRHTGAMDYYCCFWQYDKQSEINARISVSGGFSYPLTGSIRNCLRFYRNPETYIVSIVFVNGDYNYTDIFLDGPLQSGGMNMVWSREEKVSFPKAEWGQEISILPLTAITTVSGTTLVIKDTFDN